MKDANKFAPSETQALGLFTDLNESENTTTTADSNHADSTEILDLSGVANFATLKGDLHLAERDIFGGEAPPEFIKLRNRMLALLGRNGKAGLETGLLLIAIKAGLKADKDWVRYGDLIAKGRGLSSVSALNHIINRTERAARVPKILLSAMIEEGLEPIDGRNKRLVAKLADLDFDGSRDQARDLVRKEQDQIIQAKRQTRSNRAAKQKKTKDTEARAVDHTNESLSAQLETCAEDERLGLLEAKTKALNEEMAAYVPGYKLQLVPVTGASGETLKGESHSASPEVPQHARPVAGENEAGADQEEDTERWEEDKNFPLYPRIADDHMIAPLMSGDRSGLAKRIIERDRRDIEAVLKDLPPGEQAQILDYLYKNVTQSCCPAVRQGISVITSAKYIAPPLQARKGEILYRSN